MPLVRIDVNAGRSPEQISSIADAIHDAIVAEYGIPARDRFQIITEHQNGQIIAQDAGLGFERSSGVVMIQIFTQRGRTPEAKQSLYARIAEALGERGVEGNDVFIGYVENGPEDWTFGFGRAQYLTGELAVPNRA
ncbi:tautomerase family protein [Pseudoclavibacter sp. RFBJ3]|uniref:tautomerase family protein n=1 Tax=unclassified Pseudoclavibacter TaxID=2615177 RepID=UPI000CE77A7D|nr:MULTISPECIES: tautomerase family protein [unclassified Pseudoclavibacter]MBF4551746.1 tautomerase family protein [Pseudoclavibacter sp. VKM Ac-2888]PPF37569.1 tautomerase family protein [Pseudoclavibacter sp. AY1H1]PPF81028.1 tautomerase family protein [Pseudoclavibacter sp. RFBJ5]PPF94536.1 tautomerase family protein [Pseudoclavibacter sp. RFBJ3]PPF99644.1 tautomerase family protein [Pseudoclavibacter sp. RFBH5]